MKKITNLVNLDHRYVRTGEQLKKSKERIKASWSWLYAGSKDSKVCSAFVTLFI
jgi:hypothetical protein